MSSSRPSRLAQQFPSSARAALGQQTITPPSAFGSNPAATMNAFGPPPPFSNHPAFTQQAAGQQQNQPLTAFGVQIAHNTSDDSDDEESYSSAIHITITTPLLITGDDNMIAVEPSKTASLIANNVVNALKTMSMGTSGVPMIDENGSPRPIKIEIVAGTTVNGARNTIGEKAVVEKLLPALRQIESEQEEKEDRDAEKKVKREREGEDEDEGEEVSKRARRG